MSSYDHCIRRSNVGSDDVEEGQIPQHLSSMLQMILEEETQDETQGICLDFFFRNRILEFICAFGMRDVCVTSLDCHRNVHMLRLYACRDLKG